MHNKNTTDPPALRTRVWVPKRQKVRKTVETTTLGTGQTLNESEAGGGTDTDSQIGTTSNKFGTTDHKSGNADNEFGTTDNQFGTADNRVFNLVLRIVNLVLRTINFVCYYGQPVEEFLFVQPLST